MYDSQLSGKIGAWMLELEETASRNPSSDLSYEDWLGLVNDIEGTGIDKNWMATDLVSMSLETKEVEDKGSEAHRAWGPVVEWGPENERMVRVRCRQNYTAEDGSMGWNWKETEIVW